MKYTYKKYLYKSTFNSVESIFIIIKNIYLIISKAPILWYYLANLLTLAYIIFALVASFSVETQLKNVNKQIKEEKNLISQIDKLYNKNINKWSYLASPQSLERLSDQYLSNFEPIFQENSISELPQNSE